MSNSVVASVYRYVIDDVIRNVQGDFEGHGVDTSVLEDLQRSWETKIIQSRVAAFPNEEGLNDTNIAQHLASPPQSGAPTRSTLDTDSPQVNSAASLASIINNPETIAPSAASLASLAQSGRMLDDDDDDDNDDDNDDDAALASSRAPMASARKSIPSPTRDDILQTDGAACLDRSATESSVERWRRISAARRVRYAQIAQVDGAAEGEASQTAENPEDAINSDLDDTDDDEDGEDGAEETEHIVLCQYDKVTRSKNKWKCVLKDGIMLINGRDYLFQKANGDFEW